MTPADEIAQVDRNLKGRELERAGRVDEAIPLYEANLADGFLAPGPYNRLAIIYRRQKRFEEEIRVLQRAIEVYQAAGWPTHQEEARLQKAQQLKRRQAAKTS